MHTKISARSTKMEESNPLEFVIIRGPILSDGGEQDVFYAGQTHTSDYVTFPQAFPKNAESETMRTQEQETGTMADQPYSRETVDAKLETLEQKMENIRLDLGGKLDLVITKIDSLEKQRSWYLIPLGLGILFVALTFFLESFKDDPVSQQPTPIVIQTAK